jgi:hypothetical protein
MPRSTTNESSTKAKAKICLVLCAHLGQRTVLGIAVPVLSGHIDAAKSGHDFKGLTEKQIEMGPSGIELKVRKERLPLNLPAQRVSKVSGGFREQVQVS